MLFKLRTKSGRRLRTRDTRNTHDFDRQRETRERIDIYILHVYHNDLRLQGR